MSSRKQRFLDKLKVYFRFLKKDFKRNGVLVTCSHCNSSNVSFETGFDTETESTIKYVGVYHCKECKAKCSHTQIWTKSKITN